VPVSGPVIGEFPLVGRGLELERIVSGVAGTVPRAYVLAGPAGVGKSRLAAEAAQAAARLGHATAHVIATRSAAAIPFGPFAAFLPASEDLHPERLGLLRQASEAIAERAGPHRRLVLVVDDAHLLDDGSAALVHQIVQAGSCSVLASVRTPGPAPDPVTALWKEGLAERIDLGVLSEEEVRDLAVGVLGGPVAAASVRRLWQASGGNALCVRELLIGAVRSGALADDRGMWALRLPLTAPDRLIELVATRLEGLAPGPVAVLELLAAGEPLGLALLESMTVPEDLEDAERQGLIVVDQDGGRAQARMAHPIYGEVLRQRTPRSRLRRMWASLAEAVEGTGMRRREDLLRVGRWRLDCGVVGGDPGLLTGAARRARQMFDMDLAARLARAAFDAGGGVQAGIVLGEAFFSSGRMPEAEEVLAGLVPLCSGDAELASVANARSHNFGNLMGDLAAAAAVLDEALEVITDPAARLRLSGRAAMNRLFAGEPEAALVTAAASLDSDDPEIACRSSYISSIALALMGRPQEAVSVAERGHEIHRRWRSSEALQLPVVQLIGAVLGHAAGGCPGRAEAGALVGFESCVEAGDKEGQATFSLLRGWALVGQGRLDAASRAFREGASINRELRDTMALRWCLGGLALAEGMKGNRDAASAAVAELPPGGPTMFDADLVDRGRAWASVAAGEVSRARELLGEAARRAALGHLWVAEAHLLHDSARLGAPELAAIRLAELAAILDSKLIRAFALHAGALVRRSAPELESAAAGFGALGAWLLAAEASTAAAVGYRAGGLSRRASAAVRKAEEFTALCGEVRTPGLSLGPEAGRLTRRETEVAGLAAGGASNKEIAARLYVSARTVENHLQSVYAKLGVSGRDELAEALRRALPIALSFALLVAFAVAFVVAFVVALLVAAEQFGYGLFV
jgi:DNA-binding CsgD family transcriptional regulator